METMKPDRLDVAIALWVFVVGVAFIVPLFLRVGQLELELVGRYVYLGVVSVGLIGLALRTMHIAKR